MFDKYWYNKVISSVFTDADFQCDILYVSEDDDIMRCPVDTTTTPPLFGQPHPSREASGVECLELV